MGRRQLRWTVALHVEFQDGRVMHEADAPRNITQHNVIAKSMDGDPNNVVMVGAHLDSVARGPEIQNNGPGSAAILEVAEQMPKLKPRNKVRFACWGAEGIKTAAEAALRGGTAGQQYDPCYHLACDIYDNINLFALGVNADAVAYAVLQFAMNTQAINGKRG
jgi:hypothetical protein